MFAIIYMSRAAHAVAAKDLVELLNKARENNARNRISGLLLYKNGHFMQVLEGDEDQVTRKMAQISRDPRHRDVTILTQGPIAAPHFAHYAMGFVHIDAVRPERRALVQDLVAEPLFSERYRNNPKQAWDLLLSFKGTFK
jgi:hypothetical protein